LIGAEPAYPQPSFKHPVPDYVRFERPPVIEFPKPMATKTGERFEAQLKYFDYGVISVELTLKFEADWDELVRLSNRWVLAPETEKLTSDLLQARLPRAAPALWQPYSVQLSEDYYIIQIHEALDETGQPMMAGRMLATCGEQIAQIVRGESMRLSEAERNEVLQSCLSYYTTDLLVVARSPCMPSSALPTPAARSHSQAR